jgi:hypothetical protein
MMVIFQLIFGPKWDDHGELTPGLLPRKNPQDREKLSIRKEHFLAMHRMFFMHRLRGSSSRDVSIRLLGACPPKLFVKSAFCFGGRSW